MNNSNNNDEVHDQLNVEPYIESDEEEKSAETVEAVGSAEKVETVEKAEAGEFEAEADELEAEAGELEAETESKAEAPAVPVRARRRTHRGRNVFDSLTTGISVTLVLVLIGMVAASITLARQVSNSIREEFVVAVQLDDSIPQRDQQALQSYLTAQPYAKQVNYISKEQGTREIMSELDAPPEELLGSSPIPAEYEVFLRADYVNVDSLNCYMPALKERPYVQDVYYSIDDIEVMDVTIRTVLAALLVVAILLSFVSFALINNTVRLDIYARRFSIQTMKLVGARWGFIRRPFMWRALWIGLIAAIIAGGVVTYGLYALSLQNQNTQFIIMTPEVLTVTLGAILAVGLLLTLLCTFFSVNHYIRMSREKAYRK